jgi:capsular polysaccharide biosynthesis protein
MNTPLIELNLKDTGRIPMASSLAYNLALLGFTVIRKLALASAELQKKGNCWFLFPLGLFNTRFRSLAYCEVQWIDEMNGEEDILPQAYFLSPGPDYIAKKAESFVVKVPAVKLYQFKSVICHITSSHFLAEDGMYMERLPHVSSKVADYSTGLILDHSDKVCVYRKPAAQELNSGLFLGGNGSWNYYHWMIELLPKLQLAIENGILDSSLPILVHEAAFKVPSFRRTLELALKGRSVPIIYLSPDNTYKVATLYHITTPSNIAFNIRGGKFKASDLYLRESSINYVRNLVLSSVTPAPTHDKIFLARKGNIRNYNQDEIFNALEPLGFRKVLLEELTLEQQALIFSQANEIVGPTGAAWTNLIFCKPQTKCLCWMADGIGNFPSFSGLSSIVKARLIYLTYLTPTLNYYRSRYEISVKDVIKGYEELKRGAI